MAVPQGKITKLDLRIPNDLYAQIESIAIEEGAKIHHISGKPTLSPTVIKLLEEAVEQRNYVPTESEEERVLKAQTLIVSALEQITAKLAELDKRPIRQIVLGGTRIGKSTPNTLTGLFENMERGSKRTDGFKRTEGSSVESNERE
jgi:hypothetical protein